MLLFIFTLFNFLRPKGGANLKGGPLFRLSTFSLKMTLSLLLFKTKLQHKNSKTLEKATLCELEGMWGAYLKGGAYYKF